MASKSNIENLIIKLFERQSLVSKDDVVEVTRCKSASAQRILTRMHSEGRIFIFKWFKHGSRNIPVYKLGVGKDKPSPTPLTNAERCARKYRKDPQAYLSRLRARRTVKRIKEKKFGYKTNPYGVFYRIADKHSDRVRD